MIMLANVASVLGTDVPRYRTKRSKAAHVASIPSLNPTNSEEGACNICHDQAKWPAGRVERHGRVAGAIEKLAPTFSRHKCRNYTVSSCFSFIDYFERQEHAYFLSLMLVSLLSRKTTSHQTSEEGRFPLQ